MKDVIILLALIANTNGVGYVIKNMKMGIIKSVEVVSDYNFLKIHVFQIKYASFFINY